MKKADSTRKPTAKELFSSRASKAGGFSLAVMAIVLVIVIVANVLISALPEKYTAFDLTKQNNFSIGEQSKALLAGLDKDVTIYYVCQSGNEDINIKNLIKDYANCSKHIQVVNVDPVKSPAILTKYKVAEPEDNSAIVVCGDVSKIVYNSDMVQYDYSNYYYTGSYDIGGYTTENAISNAIDLVVTNDVPVIRFISGHGESDLEEYFYAYLEDSNFKPEALDLLTAGEIPAETDCLAVITPGKDFSEKDIAMFEEYMKNGGKMFVVSANLNDKDFPNLCKLLKNYGIEPVAGTAVETDADHVSDKFILATQCEHDIVADLAGYNLLVSNAQGFRLAEGAAAQGIISTTEGAFATDDPTVTKKPADVEEETLFFGAAATVGDGENAGGLVYYSTDSFMDAECIQYSYYANVGLFINSFSWLCGKENALSIPATELTGQTLTVSDSAANLLRLAFLFILPGLFLLAGIVVIIRRKKH